MPSPLRGLMVEQHVKHDLIEEAENKLCTLYERTQTFFDVILVRILS